MNHIEHEFTKDLQRIFPKRELAHKGYEDLEGRVYSKTNHNTISLGKLLQVQMSTKSDRDQYVKLIDMQYKVKSRRNNFMK
jgi:hypothetical protein